MSGYSYKGVTVNNICVNNGSTANVSGFSGMPATSATNYSSMRPLTFGYNTGNPPVDICNQYTAPNTGTITSSGNHSIPTGVKSCRVISVGGGGGAGGTGGNAKATSYNTGYSANGSGGSGGSGGYGTYSYNNYISLSGQSNIYVTIGSSGNNGGTGDGVGKNYASGKISGHQGGSGNGGGSSYITIGSTQMSVGYGGNGGEGGEGGSANVDGNDGKVNSAKGSSGNAGTPITTQSNDSNYPTLSNYGHPDTQGAVQIIWLYD
jgi:hypothetical protein